MSLQVEYRPKKLKQLAGNKAVVESLKSVLSREDEKIPHAFLITGKSGCGKTTVAYIIKNELGCDDTDFIELDAGDDRGIGAMRKLKDGLKYAPLGGNKKVIFLDEAHMLTKEAKESLLKTLEKPPSNVYIIIATTNPEVFNTTFKRRCHQYELLPLLESNISKLLDSILTQENVKKFPKKIKNHIIDLADGSAGQALKMLDQVIDMTDVDRAISTLKSAGMTSADVKQLCQAILNKRDSDVQRILKLLTSDPESTRYAICGYMNSVMLNKWDANIVRIIYCFSDSFIYSGKAGLSASCYDAIHGD